MTRATMKSFQRRPAAHSPQLTFKNQPRLTHLLLLRPLLGTVKSNLTIIYFIKNSEFFYSLKLKRSTSKRAA